MIFTRLPDVDIVERDSNKFVKGCRCISGDYRGISTFDIRVTWLNGGWKNYRIPKETALPANLAITKDHFIPRHSATHYTIAPKDDMTLELFIQSLKAIADKAEEVKS